MRVNEYVVQVPALDRSILQLPAVIIALGTVTSIVVFFILPPLPASFACILAWMMLVVSTVDYKHFIIPDVISLPAIPLGLLAAFLLRDPSQALSPVIEHLTASAFAAALLWLVRFAYWRFRGIEGLGLGDVKLAAVAGAWTGMHGASLVLVAACMAALLFVLMLRIRNRQQVDRMTVIPLGTFLAPAIWLVWTMQSLNQF